MNSSLEPKVIPTCQVDGHNQKPFNWICTNLQCQNPRFLCSKCLVSLHKECLDHTLEIDDIRSRSLDINMNWIKDSNIKEVACFMGKNNLKDTKQVLKQFEATMDREFDKLIEFFAHKVQETKKMIIENIENTFSKKNLNVESFMTEIYSLYNFDALISIVDSIMLKNGAIDAINKELENFLRETQAKEKEKNNMKETAENFESLTSIDLSPFEKFRETLSFEAFRDYPFADPTQNKKWSWSPVQKSVKIDLSENNLVATRGSQEGESNTTVIGSEPFSRGIHVWKLNVRTNNKEKYWIGFGIVEKSLVKDFEQFAYQSGLTMAVSGNVFNMEKVKTLPSYDNEEYTCGLDMEAGTFTISNKGQVIAKQKENFKRKDISTIY